MLTTIFLMRSAFISQLFFRFSHEGKEYVKESTRINQELRRYTVGDTIFYHFEFFDYYNDIWNTIAVHIPAVITNLNVGIPQISKLQNPTVLNYLGYHIRKHFMTSDETNLSMELQFNNYKLSLPPDFEISPRGKTIIKNMKELPGGLNLYFCIGYWCCGGLRGFWTSRKYTFPYDGSFENLNWTRLIECRQLLEQIIGRISKLPDECANLILDHNWPNPKILAFHFAWPLEKSAHKLLSKVRYRYPVITTSTDWSNPDFSHLFPHTS